MQDASRVRDLWYASQRAQGVGEEMASRASSERAVGVCGVPVSGEVPRGGRGVEAGSSQSIHTCSQRSYEGSAQGEHRPGGLRAEPFASDRGHSGHGCHTGGDAQAGGAPQLQEAQGVPAADHVLVRGRVDRAFGVSGRQRTCGPSAVASVD